VQKERRREPYPWTWELPVAAALVVTVVIVVGVQLGRSLANLVAGLGWTWPDTASGAGVGVESPVGTAFWTSLPGILAGDAAAGLAPPVPSDLPGRGWLWTSVTLTEVMLLALTIWAAVRLYVRWGPGRMRGMATVAEAENLLGIARLRKVASIVRPDLYGRHAHHDAEVPRIRRTAGAGTAAGEGTSIGRRMGTQWLRAVRRREERK
jgi:hypothetical protein